MSPADKTAYQKEKAKLPGFLFNVRTDGRGTNESVSAINPVLYLDIDGVAHEHFESVKSSVLQQFPSMLMIRRSAGGKGLGMLLNLGPHGGHFTKMKSHFSFFSFQGYSFDTKCFTAVRKNYLSHDCEAYVNWKAPIHVLPEEMRSGVPRTAQKVQPAPLFKSSSNTKRIDKEKEKHSRAYCTVPYVKPEKPRPIRYSNRSSFAASDGSTHTVHPDGFHFVEELWLTTRGNRTLTVLKAARKLLAINPWLRDAPCELTFHLNLYNEMRLAIDDEGILPLPIETVHKTALQAINTHWDIGNQMKKGYIAWPEGSKLTGKEKMVIAGKEGSKLKRQRSLDALKKPIDQHDDPSSLTRKELAFLAGKSLGVAKYYAREIDQYILSKAGNGSE